MITFRSLIRYLFSFINFIAIYLLLGSLTSFIPLLFVNRVDIDVKSVMGALFWLVYIPAKLTNTFYSDHVNLTGSLLLISWFLLLFVVILSSFYISNIFLKNKLPKKLNRRKSRVLGGGRA